MSKTNIAWLLVAVWVGCTSTSTPSIGAADASTDAKSDGAKLDGAVQPTEDGGKADTGKKETGTEPEEDAALGPCTPISGGLPCDTGKIFCGASNCDMATEDCCVDVTDGSSSCMAKGSCTKAPVGCDEARDCAVGEVCCFTVSGTTPTGAICQVGPCSPSDFVQSCRSDDECSFGSCVTGGCQEYTIQTCGAIPQDPCPK